ncbi:hypothetical protein F2P79_010868 [Pimephales promelas]|nr:hypothetical protein F2P79_010868 [Pimephales promelas]
MVYAFRARLSERRSLRTVCCVGKTACDDSLMCFFVVDLYRQIHSSAFIKKSNQQMVVLTSTRYVDRAMPSQVEQNPDMGSLITQLADKIGEDAMEYWIRLNKTVDVADEYLKRQGRSIDDPGHEVSMMFIKYCPDQSLRGVFKFKSAEKWSAADSTPAPDTTAPSVPSPVPMTAASVDNVCMRSLVNLLDRLVTQHTQVPASPRVQAAVPHSSQKRWWTGTAVKLENPHLGRGGVGIVDESLFDGHDPARLYEDCCAKAPKGTRIVIQATQRIEAFSELFYATVLVNHSVQLKGMLDSGSMACSISEHAIKKLSTAGVLPEKQHPKENIVLIGCDGLQTRPEGFYDLEIQLYGARCVVPTLVVPGQHDDLILGSNVIKHVIRVLKGDNDYWSMASRPEHQSDPDVEQFLSMFTNVERWSGSEVPDKIGTVKLTQAVLLLPRHEHLVWGRLPTSVQMSPGSTVVVEPTNSKAMP